MEGEQKDMTTTEQSTTEDPTTEDPTSEHPTSEDPATKESASGVKVVGASAPDRDEPAEGGPPPRAATRRTRGQDRPAPTRRAFKVASLLAVLGLLGTLTFGILYATKSSGGGLSQDPAVLSAVRAPS